ncbi:MAG TPA: NAD(P)/FAD-dependent oxidoreductase [Steroidobacteraceae bacterium]|nr:NAD(P)/FAD-dependent oxidoreductase [Steroidobacteraceae bacterium]
MRTRHLTILGAGLAGPLVAILLARRGFSVTVYERRRDPRSSAAEAGRSINLALAARGIRALEHAGLMGRIAPLLIPMRGRMVHEPGGGATLQPYGQRDEEVIYSIGRSALNRVLIEEAARDPRVTLHFEHACIGAEAARDALVLRDLRSTRTYEVPLSPTIAADGAGSPARTSLAEQGLLEAREDLLDHDYKELSVPASQGGHVLDPNALHIWPRHGFMLIALPNTDGSFTATLFLPHTGPQGFGALRTERALEGLFAREFPDVLPFMPDLLEEFRTHPQGHLGTVHTMPWHVGARVLLLGDAAHAIVPFHGQGMNAAFEDCSVLEQLLDAHEDWERLFAAFEAERRPNAAAIARMAIENYGEMRARVLEPSFLRQKAWALELERRFPGRFIPRYSMVMFHPEISYAEALRRGAVQQEILARLESQAGGTGAYDHELARQLIESRL